MVFRERIEELRQKVHQVQSCPDANMQNRLPENCWFLSDDEIVCFERQFGDSRYPYAQDGLILWAYASGGLQIAEGTFHVVLDSFFGGNVPNLCFYAGKKEGGKYIPISLTGAGKSAMEEGVVRYTVFAPEAAYYFTETAEWTSCVRMFVDEKKSLRFSVRLINGNGQAETYVASYMNLFLRNAYGEDIGMKWFKSCKRTEDGFLFRVIEDVFRSECHVYHAYVAVSEQEKTVHSTTAYSDFTGSMHQTVNGAAALHNGFFEQEKTYNEFVDNSIAATLVPLCLEPNETYETSFTVAITQDGEETARAAACENVTTAQIDALLYDKASTHYQDIPCMKFEDVAIDTVSDIAWNRFVRSVFRQVEFCARAKNYGGALIGIRDIFQQIEAAILWIPDYCRGKILEALNYIGEDGRAPRQYSYPAKEGTLPVMDLRPFIDQGVWVISTIYTYLSFTGDASILDEICGYYKFNDMSVSFSDERDSVLSHMVRIMQYLESNLDAETKCLHVLYGDWNDALDGMGASMDGTSEYGTGVSVMATLQYYQNLCEMANIMKHIGKETEAKEYEQLADIVAEGLMTYAIDVDANGERKVLHGWGDKRGYKVGSFCDCDGEDRSGLTSHSFWILSGMLKKDESLKADILRAYETMDSKYGYKTFEPYFDMKNDKVGRITHLPKGTAENGATYIHATMFAIWSLFAIGETKLAFEQLEKVIPLNHKRLTHTPFVMPNSYGYDPKKGIDGESMNDWFTGSGCVFVKILMWYMFGIKADLYGVTICPAKDLPFGSMSVNLKLKGGEIRLSYAKTGQGKRIFEVNGIKKDTYTVSLTDAELKGKSLDIRVLD